MSFYPHPKTVIAKDQTFDYLMPLSKKAAILESLGADIFYVAKFDKDFLTLSPEKFVQEYLVNMQVVHAVAGFDFSYGHRGKGHIDRLKQDSDHKIDVTKIDKIEYQGRKISSTWIRELIHSGEVETLVHILGRHYETQVQADGSAFKLASHYMMPAPGQYQVEIKSAKESQVLDVFVPAARNKIYLVDPNKHSILPHQKYDITWLQKNAAKQHAQAENTSIG